MRRDTRFILIDMVEAAKLATELIEGFTEDQFYGDVRTKWAAFSQIIIIGEAANRLPVEWRESHPVIPWPQIVGMRNRLVHGYDVIEWNLVWDTVKNDLPDMIKALDPFIPEQENS